MRSFILEDAAARTVAEGTEFTDGAVAVRYRGVREVGTSCYSSLSAMQHARCDPVLARFVWVPEDDFVASARQRSGEAVRWLRLVLADALERGFDGPCTDAAVEWLDTLAAA